jgi:hypothetical protein
MNLATRIVREAYRRERIPARACDGGWPQRACASGIAGLARGLDPHLEGNARTVLSTIGARMFERRAERLRAVRMLLPIRSLQRWKMSPSISASF